MRKVTSLLLITLIIFGVCIFPAFAVEEYSASFSYEKTTRVLTSTGKCAPAEQHSYIITVVPDGTALSDLSDSNLPVLSKMSHTSQGGSFDFSVTLPENLTGGRYNVYLTSNYFSANDYFSFVKEDEIAALLPLVNSATSPDALKNNVFEPNKYTLGIDTAIFSDADNKDVISKYMFYSMPTNGYADAPTFSKYMDHANAWVPIKNGTDVDEVLKKYGNSIDMNYETDFMKYPADVRAKLISLLKTADYTSKPLNELIKELRVLAYVKVAPTWSALKQNILGLDENGNEYVNNFTMFNVDETDYYKLNDVNSAYIKMFEAINSINTFADAKKAFKDAAASAYKNQIGGTQNPNPGHETSTPGAIGSYGGSVGSGSSAGAGIGTSVQTGFTDMSDHWANAAVNTLSAKGIIAGFPDGSFRPEQAVTRAEFIKLITVAFGISVSADISFTDVADTDWFAPYVKSGYSMGLIKGDHLNRFSPNNSITREDACVMLYRYIGRDIKSNIEDISFDDKDKISQYALDSVSFLYKQGIINGVTSKSFAPKDITTRAQAATLILRILDYAAAH